MAFRLGNLFDLTGRTALITGGNSGIGLAMARALGLAGAQVILAARRAELLEEAARALSDDNIPTSCLSVDLASAGCATTIMDGIAARKQHVDILVNAAGINLRQPFAEVTAEAFDLHMALHLRAP
ncbi:MAG: SDR family NAD(P)-dependent oxidoreductase, partial [Beijerinckiaceae bacterium]